MVVACGDAGRGGLKRNTMSAWLGSDKTAFIVYTDYLYILVQVSDPDSVLCPSSCLLFAVAVGALMLCF